jgi:predicted nucleotidyltransferase
MGWRNIEQRASASERISRRDAVIQAYAWTETALQASGLTKGSVAKRLLLAQQKGMLRTSLTEGVVRNAIRVRHDAAHDRTLPGSDQCKKAVDCWLSAWNDLRMAYVTVERARNIASQITCIDGIIRVFLFGSLARSVRNPGDIDLLVFDNGACSDVIEADSEFGYKDTQRITQKAIDLLGLADTTLDEAARCRWLDLLILNGELFGSNLDYTRRVSRRQPDPYFFLNMSKDILEYSGSSFANTTFPTFIELRRIAEDLDKLGLPAYSN